MPPAFRNLKLMPIKTQKISYAAGAAASLDSAERMVYHRLKREKIYPKSRKNDNPGNGAKNDNPGFTD